MSAQYQSAALTAAIAALQSRGGITREVRVSLGGCAEAHGTDRRGAMRRSAHAHTAKSDELRGWLCFKSGKPEVLTTPSGAPSRLLAHEWAHAATWQGHTVKWRALMVRLGHPEDAKRYEPKVRKAPEVNRENELVWAVERFVRQSGFVPPTPTASRTYWEMRTALERYIPHVERPSERAMREARAAFDRERSR